MKKLLLFLTCVLTLFGVSRAATSTISFSGIGSSGNGVVATDRAEGIFNLTFAKGGASNDPTYYASDLRMYAGNGNGNSITISCQEGYKMTGMVFTATGTSYNFSTTSASVGSLSISGTTNTWSAGSNNVTSVTFTNKGTAQVRLSGVEITYETVDPSNPSTKVKYDAPFNGKIYTIAVGETFAIDRGTDYPSSMVFILKENSVLEEDDDNFTLKGLSPGTETVDVMWEGDDNFEEGEASFTVTVTEPITGTTATAVFYATASYSGNATYQTQMTGSNIAGTSTTATVFDSGDISLWIEKINSNTSQINGNQVRWYANDVLHLVPDNGATITEVVINMVSSYAKAPTPNVGSGNLTNLIYTWTGNTTTELTLKAVEQTRFTDLTVTYIEAQTGELKKANLSFPDSEYTARMGEEFTAPALSNPFTVPVTYSSSEESVATVDANTGEVTLVGAGSTTITATFAGNDTYAEDSASYNLTVKPAMSSDVIVDEITAESFGNTFGSYGDYTYTSTVTGIIYTLYAMKGGSAGAGYNIQINNNSGRNGGLVVTANPDEYEVINVAVEQTSAAQIDVYANTDVYTGTAQLYSNPIVGEMIGSISTSSGELDNFSGDVYTGWGLRTSGGARNITKITVTYAIAEGVAKKPSLSFTFNGETVSDPVELDWNATEFPTLVLPEGITSATYTSSDTSVAEINSSSGEITLKGVKGETTITANTEAIEGQWKAGTASYTLVVLDPNATKATFDFTTKDPYGMTSTNNGQTYYSEKISFNENGATMTVAGKYRSWQSTNSYDFRIYTDDNSAIKIEAPAGYMLETIEFNGTNLNNLSTENGAYSNGIWESNADEIDTYVLFKPIGSNNAPQIKTITVWYTLDPYFYLMGTMTNNKTANPSYRFSNNGDGTYTLEVASINAYNGGQEKFVIANGNESIVYTGPKEADTDMVAGETYSDLKQWNNADVNYYMGLATTLYNVTLTLNTKENTLSIVGTPGSSDQLEVTVGNDKTMQSGSVVSSDEDGIKGNISLKTEGAGAMVYVFAPNDLRVYYAIELSNTTDQKSVKAKAGENLTYKAAQKSTFEEGAYNITLATGTSGTLYLRCGESMESASDPVAYSFVVERSVPTGVEGIESEDGEVEYYDLNGFRVNPENLQKVIYIVKKGKETYKVIR